MALLTFKMASPAGKDCKDPTGKVCRRPKSNALADASLVHVLQYMRRDCHVVMCRIATSTSRWSSTASSQPWRY